MYDNRTKKLNLLCKTHEKRQKQPTLNSVNFCTESSKAYKLFQVSMLIKPYENRLAHDIVAT